MTVSMTQAGDSNVAGTGAAKRRRERRLRSMPGTSGRPSPRPCITAVMRCRVRTSAYGHSKRRAQLEVEEHETYHASRRQTWGLGRSGATAPCVVLTGRQGARPVEEPSIEVTLHACPAPPPTTSRAGVHCGGGRRKLHGHRHLHVSVPRSELATPPP